MHFIGIFNRDGGTFRTMDMEQFCAEIGEVMAAHGHSVACRAVPGAEIAEALRAAAATAGDGVLLAGGGDGTISTAAEIAYRQGVTLAVLPAGTMNLFARALQLPMGLADAVAAIAGGEPQLVDIATANGTPFVHQFGVGVHARLVRLREGMSYSSRIGKIWASLRAIALVLQRPPRFAVDIGTRHGTERRWASGITVSNNPVGEGHIPYADTLDRGVLGVYVAKPMSSLSLLRLSIAVLLGRWKASPEVSEREVTRLTLHFPRRKRSAQAVIDGELVALPRTVELAIHPAALRVIVPRLATRAETPITAPATPLP